MDARLIAKIAVQSLQKQAGQSKSAYAVLGPMGSAIGYMTAHPADRVGGSFRGGAAGTGAELGGMAGAVTGGVLSGKLKGVLAGLLGGGTMGGIGGYGLANLISPAYNPEAAQRKIMEDLVKKLQQGQLTPEMLQKSMPMPAAK